MSLEPVSPIPSEPVTVADTKKKLNVVGTDKDAILATYITAARQWIEKISGQKIMSEQWEWTVEAHEIDGAILRLPLRPVISVDEIFLDESVFHPDDYVASHIGSDQGATIEFVSTSNVWTAGTLVTFTVGNDPVPEPLCHAVVYAVKILLDGGDLDQDPTLRALYFPYRLMLA